VKKFYDIHVRGLPKAQPRPRVVKDTGHIYTPNTAKDWKELVTAECMAHRQPEINEPVRLTVCFYFPLPKRLNGKNFSPHVSKPDIDNLLKAVQDAMTEAKVWIDDAVVFSVVTEKWYSAKKSGAWIQVEAIDDDELKLMGDLE
jgi:Holliday junction resolvase RusA-like endonuclease